MDWKKFSQVPAWYRVRITDPGTPGAQRSGAAQLRPQPFWCRRITFATSGDVLTYTQFPYTAGSTQGRACRVSFGDAFTQFFGNRSALVSAVFGDSNGFLDLPDGILLQGSQSITVELTRLFWPGAYAAVPEQDTIWDFVFHGVSLLPRGVNQAGSAG